MASMTSRMIVSLIDGVTAPARKMTRGLLGIPRAMNGANGQAASFQARLGMAISANNAALDQSRGRMMDAVAGAFVLQRGFTATVGAAMSLEDKMADIAKVSGMSGDELKTFETSLRNMARKEIPMAVEELAALAAAASQSGIANEDLDEFTRMVAKAGVAWEMSGEQTGESLAKIKTALGMTIEETRQYADVINYLSDSTASSASDLVEFSRRVAADGKVAGFTKEEVLALGAAMISAGAESEVAATSLRNVGRMLSRGDFGAKKSQLSAFKELGLDAEKVAKAMQIDASGTLLEVLEAVNEAEPHKKLAMMSGIFGDEARALMPLLTELDKTRSSIEAVGDATNYLGSVQKEFEVRSKTGSYALQGFRNQMRDIGIVIGQSLLPAMKELLTAVAPYLIAISDMISQHPKLVAGIVAAITALVGLRIAMAALRFVGLLGRGGALSLLSMGMSTVGAAGARLFGAARGTIALQAALATMSGGKLGFFGTIAAGMRGMIGAIPGMRQVGGAFRLVGTAIRAVSMILMANPIALAIAAIAGLAYLIYRNWDDVAPYFERLWEAVKGYFGGLVDFVVGIFTLDMERALGGLKQMFSSSLDFASTMYDAGVALLQAVWDGMKSIWTGMQEWVGGIGDSITAPFKGAAGKVKGWFGVDEGGGVDGQRANGGPMSAGGSYLVGEEGPEIVTPTKGGYVHPNGSRPGGGSRGQVTIAPVFHFNGTPKETADQIVAKVMSKIERATRSGLNGAYSDNGLHSY